MVNSINNSPSFKHPRRVDIKPENIFFLKQQNLDSVMIADFGLACFLENGSASTPCGTMSYMAPEMLKGRSYGKPV